ncbi:MULTISPECIES: UbiA family prenyltransferase [unclassified Variovorax]|uniref:UbiA family prenyltransferase n=1 Tax=unclassified Variovorax TaxID=663243 RepID=UPI00076D0AA8|nr:MULTISPECIES: UbiA family prenyltransferase [unclassified Variovorax]KWT82763.1 integral membrane protein [Variovorax sp. WDL1]PNG59563.1 Decaprenyl-phosphate phosphoribosyltransferase [Variovorax sp. B4]PNG60646.1 Decaprenyl-phosphate phosphoribosyltransferase [Variovorax sp. B2]VTV13457.1 Decaprenyl-phosphate phosphoribosyltransferase [Variovorax sp. WDL1]
MTVPLPLYVDLDGTLIATDSLHESLLKLVRVSPRALLSLPLWLLRGRAALKREVARRTRLDVRTLPYRPEVLDFVRRAREAGRRTILATASDGRMARRVADHLGLFDAVLASDGERNVKGANKLAAILSDTRGMGFSYAGDHTADLEVWRGSKAAVVVSRSGALARRAAGLTEVEAVIKPRRAGLSRYFQGLRPHQWLKNVLIFLPLMPVLHDLTQALMVDAVLAFLAFSLMASGIYVLNDLLDLESDRRHHRKRRRPFAAGDISSATGLAMSIGLGIASLALSAALLPPSFVAVLLLYAALTTAYSVFLKRRAVVDVFSLAALYTIRVAAGTQATGQPLSFWILSFSLFIFLSLALAKRYVELTSAAGDAVQLKRDRGYQPGDETFVLCAGVAAGQMSAVLLSLYLQDQQMLARYQEPTWLWILIPVFLFWTVRIWLKAIRGALHEDPVVFAARDWVSRLAVGIAAAALWMAH